MMCEINTDGTSAMLEDHLLCKFLTANNAFQDFVAGKDYYFFELFDSWVKEFLAVCAVDGVDAPRVAIVDFIDYGYLIEFEHFLATFLRHGIECEICDIRELTFTEGILRTKSGMAVDAIYRRAVTSDIIHNLDDIQPFIRAVEEKAVCLVGDFVTQIVHNKRFFHIIYHPLTQAALSQEEREFVARHFPYTFPLTKENLNIHGVLLNRQQWIIKPCDSYGAKGFYAGKNLSAEEWQEVCENHLSSDYILQRFHQPYRSANIDYAAENPVIHDYSNLTGVYCYNGKPYGLYSRLSSGEIITTQYDERTVATVVVHGA
jgi:hypothetical protein